MAFEPIRDAFVKLLEDVEGIGVVHNRIRHAVFWDKFFEVVNKNNRLSTWEVSRRALAQEIAAVQGASGNEPCFTDTHTLLLVGRLAVNDEDESELLFQDIIDAVTKAIRFNNRLGGAYLQPAFMQTEVIEHRTYGGALVHYCEMTLEARRREGG